MFEPLLTKPDIVYLFILLTVHILLLAWLVTYLKLFLATATPDFKLLIFWSNETKYWDSTTLKIIYAIIK